MNEQQLFIRIGSNIREMREERGMTQQDLAARCNMEKSNISRIEAGRTNLTARSALKISQALGVKLGALFEVDF